MSVDHTGQVGRLIVLKYYNLGVGLNIIRKSNQLSATLTRLGWLFDLPTFTFRNIPWLGPGSMSYNGSILIRTGRQHRSDCNAHTGNHSHCDPRRRHECESTGCHSL